jgi:hypothetical protein
MDGRARHATIDLFLLRRPLKEYARPSSADAYPGLLAGMNACATSFIH